MNNIVVAIVSSEKTFEKLDQIVFNDAFLTNRHKFDLAVVFNSNTKIENNFKTNFDYIFYRENIGLDPGGFNYLIQKLPDYNYFFLMHDDHFFLDNNWLDFSIQIIKDNPNVDILGNILFNQLPSSLQNHFDSFIKSLNLNHLLNYSKNPEFIHGISGLFTFKAIKALKSKYGSIPFVNSNDKLMAMFCERLTTLLFNDCSINYAQFPGEIFTFLYHGTNNTLSVYFSEANKYLALNNIEKAIEYFNKYIELANKLNFFNDIHLVYAHLAYIYKTQNNMEQSQYYCNLLVNCNITKRLLDEIIEEFELKDVIII
ncbi:MAG TPA: hypothetical protein PK591_03035 [Ignavibacteriales bacterium]|nr:hypothetical protein [Ignavibacteriales bacterium]HRT98174.1 hypothetical protein [Ignavibacteriales bacterium]